MRDAQNRKAKHCRQNTTRDGSQRSPQKAQSVPFVTENEENSARIVDWLPLA